MHLGGWASSIEISAVQHELELNQLRACMHVCMRVGGQAGGRACACMLMYVHACACVRACVCVCVRTCVCAFMRN